MNFNYFLLIVFIVYESDAILEGRSNFGAVTGSSHRCLRARNPNISTISVSIIQLNGQTNNPRASEEARAVPYANARLSSLHLHTPCHYFFFQYNSDWISTPKLITIAVTELFTKSIYSLIIFVLNSVQLLLAISFSIHIK